MKLIVILTATQERIGVADNVLREISNDMGGNSFICAGRKVRLVSKLYKDYESIGDLQNNQDFRNSDVIVVSSMTRGNLYSDLFKFGAQHNVAVVETSVLYHDKNSTPHVDSDLLLRLNAEYIEQIIKSSL